MTILTEHMSAVQCKKGKKKSRNAPTMQQVGTIILGGGQGTRLFPLTLTQSKPGICFGGYYRLIDVAISNAINSCSQKIYIITQFLSSSLHQHIFRTYRDEFFSNGYLQLLPAEQKPTKRGWFEGTADAVRQNLEYLIESSADYFLILSGDQLYNIDFQAMLDSAYETDADLIIASIPVNEATSKRMGLLKVNESCQIIDFIEKPQDSATLNHFKIPTQLTQKACDPTYLASMGIYLFKRQALIDLLENDQREDFGKHIIPTKVSHGRAYAYFYHGYWEDIGTIESFHKANILLTQPSPSFNCYNEKWPVFCRHHDLPGPKIGDTKIHHAILCEGAVVEGGTISNSIIGPRSVLRKGVTIDNTYVIGNNFYTPPQHSLLPQDLSIGENSVIRNAIIDKHVHIGKNVQLINANNLSHYDSKQGIFIRDHIMIVTRGAHLPDGFVL